MSLQQRYGPLRVEPDGASNGAIVVITIDHPPTNLVDGPLVGALMGLVGDLDGTPTKVVVFRSADPDFFLMHGDVESLVRIPLHEHEVATEPNIAAATFQRFTTAPFLSIAMLDGAARGGGAEFAAALDLRYGTPRTVLGQPEVPMGILPGAGGTARLARLVGRSRALEVILTGRDVNADEALALGWIDAVVASEELERYAMGVARKVAAMPAASIAGVKRVLDASLGRIETALIAETDELGKLTAAGAHHDPMRRFLAAGGQTREGELYRMGEIMGAMLEHGDAT